MEEFLKKYYALMGKPGFTDTPQHFTGYPNQWQQMAERVDPIEEENQRYYEGYQNEIMGLQQLMQKFPQHRQTLADMFYKRQRNLMDLDLNYSQFGRAAVRNNLKMDEMNYLEPEADWNRTDPEIWTPLPRRM